jgi:predicted metalloprotease
MFRRRVRLDPGQVRDLRGRGGGGAIALGGGGLGIAVLVLYLLLGGDPGALVNTAPAAGPEGAEASTLQQECEFGEDANQRQDCRIVGYVNSIQEYWSETFAQSRENYIEADTVLFDGQVNTGCGVASSQVGPFYCPSDMHIYLDLGFFEAMQTRLGAQGGSFAEGYVVAHEYGHHVQALLGFLGQGGRGAGAESAAVRTELQADCFAGVWAGNAEATGFLEPLREQDIAQALDAAEAVGDDRIQEKTQGQVDRETWTHGSSEQRMRWFTTGYETGDPDACNTFEATEL